MAWRDNYTGKGKLGNAEFLVKSSDMEFGRRVAVHEYPLRDVPYVEDLGLKAREFTLDAFVIGADYHIARDALIKEIEKSGSRTLVHPYLGTMRVNVITARKRESNREGGRCQFTLTLVIAGDNKYPDQQVDTQQQVAKQADQAQVAALDDFAVTFDEVKMIDDHLTELTAELASVLSTIEDVVSSTIDPITALIRPPYDLGVAVLGSITRLRSKIAEPLRALQLYARLFNIGEDSPDIPTSTVSRRQQATNTAAVHDLVARGALIEAARSSSEADYDTYDDAITVRNTLLDELDVQMHADDVDDGVYNALLDLRVAVVNDIRFRGADLSRLTTFTPLITLPALVIAHRLYGDADRDVEVVTRNNIRHPGFVAGGEELAVLNG